MKINGVDHVAIAVRNLKDGCRIWKDLGYKIDYEIIEEQKERVGIVHTGKERIEILEPLCEDSPISKFLEKCGEGLHHLALNVEDIEFVLRELESKGYRLIDKEPRIGTGGKKIAFVHPKDTKFLLELVEG